MRLSNMTPNINRPATRRTIPSLRSGGVLGMPARGYVIRCFSLPSANCTAIPQSSTTPRVTIAQYTR